MPRNLIFSLTLLALAGCDTTPDHVEPVSPLSAQLTRFSSCDELRDHTTDAFVEVLVQNHYGYGWELDDAVPEADLGGAEGPTDHSTTNLQEAGVDELDIVKTDGSHVYVASERGELIVVKSWPVEDSEITARLSLSGQPVGMFLKEDTLVVYSHTYDLPDLPSPSSAGFDGYGTRIEIIDLGDRTDPQIIRTIELEGAYVNARRVGDDVYTVLNSATDLPRSIRQLVWDQSLGLPPFQHDSTEAQLEAARAQARGILRPRVAAEIDALSLEELLPRVLDQLPGQSASPELLLDCTEIYRPEALSQPSVLSVVHLSLDDAADSGLSGTGILSEGWMVYASQENLYVAQNSYSWWWNGGYDDGPSSHIHQFTLQGGETTYQASGSVAGWLLNSFSMGEHDGHLRVATSEMGWGWGWGTEEQPVPANNVFVLQAQGDALQTVGEVRGIAPGEQIYAARFQGERGYLVTFEQIDPLFTLDLSVPTDPQVIGELKIPGYSAYLHPVGENHLLAVGMDGDLGGRLTGLAINLFDISDFANPTLQDQLTFTSDWAGSAALWDHHAFTFHRDVLTVPLYTHEYGPGNTFESFSGAVSIDVDTEAGLFEVGRVDHADLIAESECLYGGFGGCDDYWYASLKRSVVLEDNLLTISDYGIKVTDLHDPSAEHARVLFWPLTQPQ